MRAAVVLVAITLLGLALRFIALGKQGYWYDEADTVLLSRQSLPHLIAGMTHPVYATEAPEVTPPLYFVLTWFWSRLVGDGEASLRALSALAGALTIPMMYAAARQLADRRTACFAALLTACNPMLVWYSMEARSYALLVLLETAATFAFFAFLRRSSPRALTVWTLCSAAAIWTHYYAILLIVPMACWLLVRYRSQRTARSSIAFLALAAAALMPLALQQLRALQATNWIAGTPLSTRIGSTLSSFALGPAGAPGGRWLATGLAIALGFSVIALVGHARHDERSAARPAAVLLGGGVAVQIALLAAGFDQVDTRNQILLLVPLILVIACGLGACRARALGIAAVAVACGCGIAAVLAVDLDVRYQRPDWRPVAAALSRGGSIRHRAIFVENGCQQLPLSVYLPYLSRVDLAGGITELDAIEVRRRTDPGASRDYTVCYPARANRPVPARIGPFRTQATRVIGRFVLVRLVSPVPSSISSGELAAKRLDGALIEQK